MNVQTRMKCLHRLTCAGLGLLVAAIGGCGDGAGDDGGPSRAVGETTVDLDARTETVRSGEALLGNLVADAVRAGVPDAQVALVNAGALRYDATARSSGIYPAGPITESDVHEMMPFELDSDDTTVLVTLTGAQLASVLDRAVSSFNTAAAETAEERRGWFLHISGGSFVADISKQAQIYNPDTDAVETEGQRIESLQVGGQDVTPDGAYKVATTGFIAGGQDGHKGFTEGTGRTDSGKAMPTLLIEYLEANSPVTPVLEGRITLK